MRKRDLFLPTLSSSPPPPTPEVMRARESVEKVVAVGGTQGRFGEVEETLMSTLSTIIVRLREDTTPLHRLETFPQAAAKRFTYPRPKEKKKKTGT